MESGFRLQFQREFQYLVWMDFVYIQWILIFCLTLTLLLDNSLTNQFQFVKSWNDQLKIVNSPKCWKILSTGTALSDFQ